MRINKLLVAVSFAVLAFWGINNSWADEIEVPITMSNTNVELNVGDSRTFALDVVGLPTDAYMVSSSAVSADENIAEGTLSSFNQRAIEWSITVEGKGIGTVIITITARWMDSEGRVFVASYSFPVRIF